MHDLGYRRATLKDREFVVQAILDAERSGAQATVYEALFGVDAEQLAQALRTILDEEIPGSELCCDNFWLALEERNPIGCLATWIEARTTPPSSIIRANALSYAFGSERWIRAQPRLRLLGTVDLKREPGALQIEAVYAAPSHRGKGVVGGLLAHALEACRSETPDVRKAQILSVIENQSSARAFSKAGFGISARSQSNDPELTGFFPGTGRLLWEKNLQ
jgi:hypothetical protein